MHLRLACYSWSYSCTQRSGSPGVTTPSLDGVRHRRGLAKIEPETIDKVGHGADGVLAQDRSVSLWVNLKRL